MEQKYIIVKGDNGSNIWEIIDCLGEILIIHTRETTSLILKEDCKCKDGSSLLYYNGIRQIEPSDIEIEKWSEYENYLLHNVYEEDLKI